MRDPESDDDEDPITSGGSQEELLQKAPGHPLLCAKSFTRPAANA